MAFFKGALSSQPKSQSSTNGVLAPADSLAVKSTAGRPK
uniref:Uncharacterized protein n=1 Tax=Anguilla anguilla TaxID=7936 RepID=A0A0E9TWJ7_ANGAN